MLHIEGNHACGRFSCHCVSCMIATNLYNESLRCLLCFENLSEVWVSDQVSDQSLQVCQTMPSQPSHEVLDSMANVWPVLRKISCRHYCGSELWRSFLWKQGAPCFKKEPVGLQISSRLDSLHLSRLPYQNSGSAGPHDQVQSILLVFLRFHHTESTCSGNEFLSCPRVGLRRFRSISIHRTCAAILPAHWDVSDPLMLENTDIVLRVVEHRSVGFSTLVPTFYQNPWVMGLPYVGCILCSIHGLLETSTHLASLSSWLFARELYEYPHFGVP